MKKQVPERSWVDYIPHVLLGIGGIVMYLLLMYIVDLRREEMLKQETQEQQSFGILTALNSEDSTQLDELYELKAATIKTEVQTALYKANRVAVLAGGKDYVTSPKALKVYPNKAAEYAPGKMTGTWEGKAWEITLKPGDMLTLQELPTPCRCVNAVVSRYNPETTEITEEQIPLFSGPQ